MSDQQNASSRSDWLSVAESPNPEDLGYEPLEWETIEARDGKLVVLPSDEMQLAENAFIVADEDDVCDLSENC